MRPLVDYIYCVDYDELPTEQANADLRDLDLLDASALVECIHQQDLRAIAAVGRAAPEIALAVERIATSLRARGRLIYVGAGTSGRLGVLDAAECPPTFGTKAREVVGVIAGGRRALTRAVEGAEDSHEEGQEAMRRLAIGPPDVVCGITASGVTPFVLAALGEARRRRCPTILVTCAPRALVGPHADITIALDVGPEAVAGSTRMKAGLATKAVLHTLTTAAMIRLGKVYDNQMVDVQPTNHKLRLRAARMVSRLTGLSSHESIALLERSRQSPKLALIMHFKQVTRSRALTLLHEADGYLRAVIGPSRR